MYIDMLTNNGKPYLRLVHAVRKENAAGKKVSTKQTIMNIGPLDRFDDGEPNYLERLRKSFRAGKPLIAELEPYCLKEQPLENYSFSIKEGSADCIGHPRLYCHMFLEKIIEELGLQSLFASYKKFSKIEFDVYGFAKLLIFGRVLSPASKLATTRQNEDYYEPVLKDFNPDNIYDTLTFIAENKDKIIRRMNTNLVKKAHRSPNVIFYDVTNFYFEIEEPDEDIYDDEGNVLEKGMRKMGVCKEERKLPIVQMGLFMDDNGVPIAVESFPGNTLDHLTLCPALKKNIDDLELSRFILIGDRGMCNYKNLLHILDEGNGYIISKSLLKSTQSDRDWTYFDDDYIALNEDFKYKSRVVKKTVKIDGKSRVVEEKVIVYWSRKFQKRCEAENKSFLDFLKKLEESPANFRVTSTQSKCIRKYLGKNYVNKNTGEVLNSNELKPMIDFDKVNEFKKGMGYYQIVTSELTMDPLEVIDKYHGLTQIEDQFRVMKGVLETRPLYVRTPEHINAHLLICLISLVIMRIIQNRIVQHEKSNKEENNKSSYWTYGLSAERVQEALKKWKVDKLQNDLYRFTDIDDPDLKRILDTFQIEIPEKLYRRGDLKTIKSNTKIFI